MWLVLGSAPLAVTVSVSLVAASALATVIQDLLSLVIYFAVAAAVMG